MAATLDAQPQQPHHHLLPPPPPQPFSRVTTCERHPDQQVTGFCASCLRERLAGLDTANRRLNAPSSASGAFRSLFFRPAGHGNADAASAASRSSFLPELRRCKSFSGGRGGPSAAAMEPQRKSCDVRVRNTLWSLFHLDDGGEPSNLFHPPVIAAAASAGGGEIEVEPRSLRLDPSVAAPVLLESREEEDEEEGECGEAGTEGAEAAASAGAEEVGDGEDDEIRASLPVPPNEDKQEEIEGEEELMRTMKDHIDLNAQSKKPSPRDLKEIAGSFWLAASVFSKKLQKWRRKQKLKKHGAAAGVGGTGSKPSAVSIRADKPPSRSRRFFRDTQSELAEDAFGRRSCDTDPRFSLDAGRISFDDPRFSWDEPRASWDGYLTGGRSVFPRLPPMLSVTEDLPVAAPAVQRLDGEIPVEEDSTFPGGSSQTRDYYQDTSQRRRRSLDRSSSVRRPSFEADELPKSGPNAAMPAEYLHLVNKFERDCGDPNSNALRDDYSESFDSAYRDQPLKNGGNPKKSRRWSKAWSLWGLIHRRGRSRGAGANGVERSFSETWPELGREEVDSRKVFRCNSSVSSRHSCNGNGNAGVGLGGTRRSGLEIHGHGKKRAGEFVLERNRSAKYSPGHIDGGLLRFYLTPMRSSSRRGSAAGKGRHLHSHAFTRSMLQLY